MSEKQIFMLGSILIIVGCTTFLVSTFNLDKDGAWLSSTLISIISTVIGVIMVEEVQK